MSRFSHKTGVSHHPSADVLRDYHSGRVDEGARLILGTHIHYCAHCRSELQLMDQIGGAFLEETAPVALSEGALALALARIERPFETEAAPQSRASDLPSYFHGMDLPPEIHKLKIKPRYWAAPGVWIAPIEMADQGLEASSKAKTYFMHVAPGLKMPIHDHAGVELTLILKGAYSDDKGRYGVGDVVLAEPGQAHAPHIASEESCLCLITSQDQILPKTWLGKLLQPLARI